VLLGRRNKSYSSSLLKNLLLLVMKTNIVGTLRETRSELFFVADIINVYYAFATLDLTGKYEKEFRPLWAAVVGFDPKMITGRGQYSFFRSLHIRSTFSSMFLLSCWGKMS
jgi:hypothetical protein